jgi:hypothetical protein
MPEAKVPCESCPWVATGKKRAAIPETDRAAVAAGAWRACEEDGGTCYGAVRFTASAAATAYREPAGEAQLAVSRQQAPTTADHRTTHTAAPAQGVDFITTGGHDDAEN